MSNARDKENILLKALHEFHEKSTRDQARIAELLKAVELIHNTTDDQKILAITGQIVGNKNEQ